MSRIRKCSDTKHNNIYIHFYFFWSLYTPDNITEYWRPGDLLTHSMKQTGKQNCANVVLHEFKRQQREQIIKATTKYWRKSWFRIWRHFGSRGRDNDTKCTHRDNNNNLWWPAEHLSTERCEADINPPVNQTHQPQCRRSWARLRNSNQSENSSLYYYFSFICKFCSLYL